LRHLRILFVTCLGLLVSPGSARADSPPAPAPAASAAKTPPPGWAGVTTKIVAGVTFDPVDLAAVTISPPPGQKPFELLMFGPGHQFEDFKVWGRVGAALNLGGLNYALLELGIDLKVGPLRLFMFSDLYPRGGSPTQGIGFAELTWEWDSGVFAGVHAEEAADPFYGAGGPSFGFNRKVGPVALSADLQYHGGKRLVDGSPLFHAGRVVITAWWQGPRIPRAKKK